MSLLLDALKKAAEQKAKKGGDESHSSADGTQLSDGSTQYSADSDVTLDRTHLDHDQLESSKLDETEIKHSDLETRLEETGDFTATEQFDATQSTEIVETEPTQIEEDSTSVDIVDQTEIVDETEIVDFDEDRTLILNDDDVTAFMGDEPLSRYASESESSEDSTEIVDVDETKVDIDDETEIVDSDSTEIPRDFDPTEVSDEQTDVTEFVETVQTRAVENSDSEPAEISDDVTKTQLDAEDTQLEYVETWQGEKTDIDEPEHTETWQEGKTDAVDTEYTETWRGQSGDNADTEYAEEPESEEFEEDLSLTEYREDDSQNPLDAEIELVVDDGDELALVEQDETATYSPNLADISLDGYNNGETLTSTTAPRSRTRTTGINLETLTNDGTVTRSSDSTSTRTYAPDNYDRTLMKLPADDASKIFAGMKAESDVVMTPDYAKKVFVSKSSVQRMQHYKAYGAIGIILFLAIAIFGVFEYQGESEFIETSLRPLKRDPLPGVIKPKVETPVNLFGENSVEGIDNETLKIVENAENNSDSEVIVSDESEQNQNLIDSLEGDLSAGSETDSADPDVSPTITSDSASEKEPEIEIAAINLPSESGQSQNSEAESETSSSSSLQISSSEKLDRKDVLLTDAYQAFQNGDHDLALGKYNQVLGIDPRNRNALLARAAIYVHRGNSATAIADYQTLLVENPKDSQAMTSMIAVANISPEESESQLKIMIRDEPDSHYLNFALANVYGSQNRWPEAQSHYFNALQNNPDNPNYAYNLAVSLEHIAQPAAAVNYYRLALDNFENGLATFDKDIVGQRLEVLNQL